MTTEPTVIKEASFPLQSNAEIASARHGVRGFAMELGLSALDLTKVVTAASELARNTVEHGGGGAMCLQIVRLDRAQGLRATFTDHGPGMPEVALAMTDGYSSVGSMGLGLPGAKRLVNDFAVTSTPTDGTCVTIVKWKR